MSSDSPSTKKVRLCCFGAQRYEVCICCPRGCSVEEEDWLMECCMLCADERRQLAVKMGLHESSEQDSSTGETGWEDSE